jgi:hypothetical protein
MYFAFLLLIMIIAPFLINMKIPIYIFNIVSVA